MLAEGNCPLRNSEALTRRSNSAVRATEVEYSRRFLRELDEAPEGNNLQYILKCPCIPFFGNQELHNEIMLGGNGGRSGVMCVRGPLTLSSLVVWLTIDTAELLRTPMLSCGLFFS